MFFLIILVAIALCALIIYLPQAAGLTTVEKHKRRAEKPQAQSSSLGPEYSGYVPPDEELRLQNERKEALKKERLRDKVNITSEDMPIRIRLHQDGVLRKRGERSVGDTNPNNYDYDIDELIQEEIAGDQKRNAQEVYASQHLGGDKEAMV